MTDQYCPVVFLVLVCNCLWYRYMTGLHARIDSSSALRSGALLPERCRARGPNGLRSTHGSSAAADLSGLHRPLSGRSQRARVLVSGSISRPRLRAAHPRESLRDIETVLGAH